MVIFCLGCLVSCVMLCAVVVMERRSYHKDIEEIKKFRAANYQVFNRRGENET